MQKHPPPPQPVRPGPPSHPSAPRTSRGYGWLVLGGALVWAALVTLAIIASGSGLWSILLAIGEVKTPTPDGAQRARTAATMGLAAGIGALLLLLCSLILDLIAAVASIRRLDGRRGDRAVPIITLAAVTIGVVLPVILFAAALASPVLEHSQLTALLIRLLLLVVLIAAPLARLVQGMAGIIRLITGEPAEPAEPALPPAAYRAYGR